MDRDAFWKIIDQSRSEVDEVEEVPAAVAERLSQLSPDEIVSFREHQDALMGESYRWDLWAVAYIVNGGCSDDGFDYFRGWLLANGKQRWEAAMKEPKIVGEWAEPDAAFCEEMLYSAGDAYKAVTGNELPQMPTSQRPSEPSGEKWEESDLERLYPALCKKFF